MGIRTSAATWTFGPAVVALWLATGCGAAPSPKADATSGAGAGDAAPADVAGDGVPLPAGASQDCQPLVGAECMSAIPSFFWTRTDASTATGTRVDLPRAAMPTSKTGVVVEPAEWNRRDGFSNAMPTIILLPSPPDASRLADELHTERSVGPDAPTWMVDLTTGQRMRHVAELDKNAKDPSRAALILRPWTVPPAGHRIAVALTKQLVDLSGKPYPRTPAMQALFSGQATGYARLDAQRQDWQETRKAFESLGLASQECVALWHYQTASEAWTSGVLRAMRDLTMAATANGGLGIVIDQAEVAPEFASLMPKLSPTLSSIQVSVTPQHPDVAVRLVGKFEVPLFLTGSGLDARLNWVGNGPAVALQGTTWRPFVLLIPPKALLSPTPPPLVLYGHGFLRGACIEMCHKAGAAEFVTHFAAAAGFVMVGTDWWGLSQAELGVALGVVQNFNLAPQLTEKLVQAAIGPIALSRAVRGKLLGMPVVQVQRKDGTTRPPADPQAELLYYGNSLGGIMGTTAVAIHPDIGRAVLNVAGGVWSTLMNRSSNFNTFLALLGDTMPDAYAQQVALALLQSQWDLSDPVQFASFVAAKPLPGSVANRRGLWTVSWGDSQVPNYASGTLARAAQAPLLTPAVQAWVDNVTAAALTLAGQPSATQGDGFAGPQAFVQWDSQRGTHPPGNALPWPDNEAHYATRWMPEFQQMVYRFLVGDGKIDQHYCLGRDTDGKLPCDLPQLVPKIQAEEPPLAVLPPP